MNEKNNHTNWAAGCQPAVVTSTIRQCRQKRVFTSRKHVAKAGTNVPEILKNINYFAVLLRFRCRK